MLICSPFNLTSGVITALNAQITHEFENQHKYIAMANYCDSVFMMNIKAFFLSQAEGEKAHAEKIISYMNDAGAEISYGPIQVIAMPKDFNELADLFLSTEVGTTQKLNGCFSAARADNDFMTESFLQWFMLEQIEEMNIARDFATKIMNIEDYEGLLVLDHSMHK